jgi:hypothetical protein
MAPDDFPAGGYLRDYLGFWAIWVAAVAATFVFFRLTKRPTGRLRLVAGNLLVLLVLLSTALVLGETYLRYVYDSTDSYGLMLTNRAWFIRHVQENSDGYRDAEFARAKRPGTVRVACVGDSFTMGWGVRDPADAFPQRVGAALEAASPGRFDVRNYGVPGFTTGHELQLVEKLAGEGDIDRVILGYCLNDPDDLLPPERWFLREKAPRLTWIRPTRSFVADFLWFRSRLADDPHVKGYFDWVKEAYDDPKVFGAQCDRFRIIADTCARAGMRLDVVVFPMFSMWGEPYPLASCHDRVALAWRRLGVEALDLREAYAGLPGSELVVNRFDAHPNARAHEIAARTILDRLFGVR